MKRTTMFTTAAAALALSAGLLAQTKPIEKTITGRLADQMCAGDGKTDDGDSDACALSCAKRGEAMVIIAKDGLYTITGAYTANKNEKMLPFVAKTVTAKGTVTEKDGKKVIDVTSIDAAKQP